MQLSEDATADFRGQRQLVPPIRIAKMAVVTVLIAAGFIALGELRKDEIRFFQLIIDRFISRK